jgi:hypothetical protein
MVTNHPIISDHFPPSNPISKMIKPVILRVIFQLLQLGMAIRLRVPDNRRVPDPMGTGTGMIFYPRVAPVPNLNRDGYETSIFSHLRVTRRVPNTLLPL